MLIPFELVFKESSHTHTHTAPQTLTHLCLHKSTCLHTHKYTLTLIHTNTPRERDTHTLSALQCFFITNQPQEIINEGLGGYTAAKPRRMSEQRENYLLKEKRTGHAPADGQLERNSFPARKFLRCAKPTHNESERFTFPCCVLLE